MVMNVGKAFGAASWAARMNVPSASSPARGHADAVHGVAREAVVVDAGVLVVEVQDSGIGRAVERGGVAGAGRAATSTRSISSCSDAQPVRTDVLASSTAML